MKKILSAAFALLLLVGVTSCTDPQAEEIFDLRDTEVTACCGESTTPPEPPPPGN